MILKEPDPFTGDEAEVPRRLVADRMSYYLRRYYRRSADVDVLNDLRIPSGNSVARIDHLLLHAHGMLLIAREALHRGLRIDGEGRWRVRLPDGGHQELGSPITHAYVQGLLLKSFLDRRVRQRGFFDGLELDVLVVLDDAEEVMWPDTGPLAEVCRRDAVHDRVRQRLAPWTSDPTGRPGPLNAAERRKLGNFLIRSHVQGA